MSSTFVQGSSLSFSAQSLPYRLSPIVVQIVTFSRSSGFNLRMLVSRSVFVKVASISLREGWEVSVLSWPNIWPDAFMRSLF